MVFRSGDHALQSCSSNCRCYSSALFSSPSLYHLPPTSSRCLSRQHPPTLSPSSRAPLWSCTIDCSDYHPHIHRRSSSCNSVTAWCTTIQPTRSSSRWHATHSNAVCFSCRHRFAPCCRVTCSSYRWLTHVSSPSSNGRRPRHLQHSLPPPFRLHLHLLHRHHLHRFLSSHSSHHPPRTDHPVRMRFGL